MSPRTDAPLEPLPIVRAAELADDEGPSQSWLIEGLWSHGVGVVGGCPKLGKTWLGLEMAVSVASGTPCLGQYSPPQPGRVLVYMAEDALFVVRDRLGALCRHHGVAIEDLDLFVITAPTLRIDVPRDQQRLREAIARLRPRMLLLDPFVRLHQRNENDAGEVSALLAYLRELQRLFDMAVVLVHHARKSGAGRPGQALRGSGDVHAWGDSNLYLTRKRDRLELTIEHRAAACPEPVEIALVGVDTPHLELRGTVGQGDDLAKAALEALRHAAGPMTARALRDRLRARNERVVGALRTLAEQGSVERYGGGWRYVPPLDRSRSAHRDHQEGNERDVFELVP